MNFGSLTGAVISLAVFATTTVHVAYGQVAREETSGFVAASDGAQIHYVVSGRAEGVTSWGSTSGQPLPPVITFHRPFSILFVPGWTMPEWIWQKQIDYFSPKYRVVAIDPRCQGESSQTSDGLYPAQMARDIKTVIDQLHLAPVVLVGWSMAVGEIGAYVDQFGTTGLAGIVLVDGGFGDRGRPGSDADLGLFQDLLSDRQNQARTFVRQICFKRPQPEDYLNRVTQASLKVPTNSAVALLAGYFSANYWATAAKFDKPTLIVGAKSTYDSDLREEHDKIAGSQLVLLDNVGHALFVDAPEEFNSAMDSFLAGLK